MGEKKKKFAPPGEQLLRGKKRGGKLRVATNTPPPWERGRKVGGGKEKKRGRGRKRGRGPHRPPIGGKKKSRKGIFFPPFLPGHHLVGEKRPPAPWERKPFPGEKNGGKNLVGTPEKGGRRKGKFGLKPALLGNGRGALRRRPGEFSPGTPRREEGKERKGKVSGGERGESKFEKEPPGKK